MDVSGSIPLSPTTPFEGVGPLWGFRHPNMPLDGFDSALTPHWVYVIASGQSRTPVKIGITHDIPRRLAAFRAGNPAGLTLLGKRRVARGLARQVEGRVHAIFADRSIGREWFDVTVEEALPYIHRLCFVSRHAMAVFREECRAAMLREFWERRAREEASQ